MKLKQFFSLFSVLVTLPFLSGCAGPDAGVLKRADKIDKTASKPGYSLAVIAGLAAGIKHEDFSAEKVKHYSDAELTRLYETLSGITFLFPEYDSHVALQEKVFQEKVARRIYNEHDTKDMYKTYLGARMFGKATEIKQQFPDIKFFSMPEKIISDNPAGATLWRVYNVPDEGKTIELKALPLDRGTRVVMVMLPGCAMGEAAMEEIMAAPDLAPAFRKYGTVITNRFNAESVALWKNHFNFPEVYLAYKASDFPGFDFHTSPHFYFLRDGEIVSQLEGWGGASRKEENRSELLKGFQGISVSTQ